MKSLFVFILFTCSIIECLAVKPDRQYLAMPDSFGLSYKNERIQTPDGFILKAWIFRPEKEKDRKITIVLAYGDAGNMSYWLREVAAFIEEGYTILTFDYRGYGKSSDFTMDQSFLYYDEFATDLVSVLKWTKQNIKNKKTGIWAVSMGTIASTMALQTVTVDFLIADAFVYNPAQIVQRIKQQKGKIIKLPPSAKNYPTLTKQLKPNLLFFAGTVDIVTTLEDSKELVKHYNKARLIEFHGNHARGIQTLTQASYGDLYLKEINSLIAQLKS